LAWGGVENWSEEGARAPSLVVLIATHGPATNAPDEGMARPARGGPLVEVCAVAKRDLAAGEVLGDSF